MNEWMGFAEVTLSMAGDPLERFLVLHVVTGVTRTDLRLSVTPEKARQIGLDLIEKAARADAINEHELVVS